MKGNKFINRIISGCMAAMLVAGSMCTDMPVFAADTDDSVSVNAVDVVSKSVEQQIPEDAVQLSNGHYYYYYTDNCTWDAAEAACEALGGHLITATTEEEVEFVRENGNGRVWLGGFRDGFLKWFWVTGESFDYTNGVAPWNAGEPNSTDPYGETRLVLNGAGWNDVVKTQTMPYICEWDEYTEFLKESDLEKKHVLEMLEDENIYKSWGNHRYLFIKYYKDISWLEAEELCEQYGGHLFTITSDEEAELNSYFISVKDYDAWLGGFRDTKFNWRWVTGESFDYANEYCNNKEAHSDMGPHCDFWAAGEPNGAFNTNMENRLEYKINGWNDIDNNAKNRQFVFEIDDYHKMIYPSDVEAYYAAEDTYCSEHGHTILDSTSYDYKDETSHTRSCYLCGEIAETTEHIIEYNEYTGEEHKGECTKCGQHVEGEHILNDDGECKICGSFSFDKKTSLVLSVEDLKYTGKDQFPAISIFDGQEMLVKDEDYTFEPEKKVNAGTYNIDIVGIGKYFGTKTVEWSIEKAQPELAFTKLSDDATAINGVTVSIAPEDATAKIVIEYKDADGKWSAKLPGKTGRYAVRAYMPEESANLLAITEDKAIEGEYVINDTLCKHDYDGQPYIGGGNGTHYKECKLCHEMTEPEKCTPGQEVIEKDEKVVYCQVCKDELSREKLQTPDEIEDEKTQVVVSENKIVGKIIIDANGGMAMTAEVPEKVVYTGKKITFPSEFTAVDSTGKIVTLAYGNDYKVSYKKNVNAGTAQIIIKGLGEYKKAGTLKKSFGINAVDISDKLNSKVLAADLCFEHAKKGKVKANVQVTFDGKKLKNKRDYTLKLLKEDGSEVACSAKTKLDSDCQIKIVGNKNFVGERSISVSFNGIDDSRKLLSNATVTGISAQKYTGKPVELDFSKISVNAGEALEYGKDFTVEYYNNVSIGMAAVKMSATADSTKVTGSKLVTFKIYGNTMSMATVKLTVDGKQIGTAKDMQIAFNGNAIIPDVQVNVGGDVLKKDVDYTVSFIKNRKAGTAQVIITGKGSYTGVKKVKFKISK